MKERIRDFFMYNNMDCMGWRWKKRFVVLLGLILTAPSLYGIWFSFYIVFPNLAMMGLGKADNVTNALVGAIVGAYVGIAVAVLVIIAAAGVTLLVSGISEGCKTKKW